MEEALSHAGPLSLLVEPYAPRAVVDVAASDNCIYRRVHLYASDFCSREVLLVIDVMDMAVLYSGKHSAEMSDDTGLSAVMDVASSYDMRSYGLF